MNVITITGNVGADAKLVSFTSGDAVSFSVGVSESAKNPDGTWGSRTVWYSCQCANTNLIQHLLKGVSVLVQGKPYAVVGNDGKAYINIRVNTVEILGRPHKSESM